MGTKICGLVLSNYPDDNGFVRYPRDNTFNDADSDKFKMLWIFRTAATGDMEGVLKIKRNSWLKYERGEPGRYYQDYMKLFITEKELSNNNSRVGKNDEYRVRIFLIKDIPFRNEMTNTCESEKELMDVVTKYRVIYGNKVLLSTEYKNYYCPPPEPVPPEPTPSPEERRKQSRKKYEDSIRESLREKSRKYYALNKERLREKRLAKTQNVAAETDPTGMF
jgi:hypothetical protein